MVLTEPSGRRPAFQQAPEHEQPRFPDPRGSQQFHLDIRVDDIETTERDTLALGATRVTDAVEDGEFRVFLDPAGHPYWHLVLACGSNAVSLELPGGEAAMRLRSLSDAVILRMAALHADSAVVVGGGLIGCEAASSLAMRGLSTTLIAPEPVPWDTVPEFWCIVTGSKLAYRGRSGAGVLTATTSPAA